MNNGQTPIALQQLNLQRLNAPTSHQYGGLGKIALAAASAIGQRKQNQQREDQKTAEAALLQSILTNGNTPEGLPDAGGLTPEMFKAALSSKHPLVQQALLSQFNKTQKTSTLSPEQAQGLGFAEGTVAQQSPDGSISVLQKPEATGKRTTAKDANDRLRYTDDGSLVFPNVEKAAAKGEGLKPTDITGIRKDFTNNTSTKQYREQAKSYRELTAIADKGVDKMSAQDDIAMLIKFMKINDPGSVVREGEFATAAQSMGLGQRIIQFAAKVDKGERLTPEARQAFMDTSLDMFMAATDTFGESRNAYQNFIQGRFPEVGDASDLAPDYSAPFRDQIEARKRQLNPLSALPQGSKDNGDGTFTLPDGRVVKPE